METLVTKSVLHPLEPLTAEEMKTAVKIIRGNKNPGPELRFISIALKEPAKSLMKTSTECREAFAVLYDSIKKSAIEVLVSLTEGNIKKWKEVPGVQPTLAVDEQIACERAVLNSEEFKEKIKQYGITDSSLVMVDIWSAGYYGKEEEKDLRLARPLCFVRTDPTDNIHWFSAQTLRVF